MAELLATEYSLAVLRVELSADGAEVQVSLVVNEAGHRRTAILMPPRPIDTYIRATADGLLAALPDEVGDTVAEWTDTNTTSDTVLWLHLVKPYGLLGAVPWEQLSAVTGRRLMRLPDVLPTQSRLLLKVVIAVCASSPTGDVEEVIAGVDALEQVISELEGLPITVHYFVDAAAVEVLRQRPVEDAFVRIVHDPPAPDSAQQDPGSTAQTGPWLSWLTEAASHEVFDVVHLLGHAVFGGYGEQGLLLLAASPTAPAGQAPRRIGSAELLHLATRTATYGLGLGSLGGNPSHDAMRTVADAVGSRRAGPVFLGAADAEGTTAVRDAYIVMYTSGGSSLSEPGSTPRMLLYAQPSLALQALEMELDAQELSLAQDTEAMDSLEQVIPATDRAPSAGTAAWADVLASYVDQRRAEVGRLLAEQRDGQLGQTSQAYVDGLAASLRSLTDILAEHEGGAS